MKNRTDLAILLTVAILVPACGGMGMRTPNIVEEDDPLSTEADLIVDEVVAEVIDVKLDVTPDTVPPSNLFDEARWPIGDESGILELLHESTFFQARPHLITEMST